MLNDVNIYPNPAINEFTVEFSTNIKTPIDIYLFNGLGEKVKAISSSGQTATGLTKHKYEIDTTTLDAGIYSVEIVTEQSNISRRLVLMK